MPSFRSAFPKKYLSASDLLGTKPSVSIANVEFGDVGHGSQLERKLLMTFVARETTFPHGEKLTVGDREQILKALEKAWVLNKTNAEAIADLLHTDDYEDWGGQRLELIPTKVEFQGKRVDGIRCGASPRTKKSTHGSRPTATADDIADDDVTDNDVPF